MRFTRAWLAAATVALGLLGALAAACGDDDAKPGTASPSAAASASVAASPSPTSSPTPVSPTATPTAAGTPTPTPKPAGEGPRVQWMLADASGAGVVTVRIATDIETTARLEVHLLATPGTPVGPPPAPQTSDRPTKLHVISTPVPPTAYDFEVTVTGADGQKANATLDWRVPVLRQFWGGPTNTPEISTGTTGTRRVAWTTLKGSPGPGVPGAVLLFAKKAGCTVAEACQGELVGRFDSDAVSTSPDRLADLHQVTITFPDAQKDYQVLLLGRPAATAATLAFFQIDVSFVQQGQGQR